MVCKNCNNQIPDSAEVCSFCATPTRPVSGGPTCPFCGATLNPGDAFCVTCGNRLTAPEIVERPVVVVERESRKKKGNGALIAVIISLAVVVIGLAVFIFVQNNGSTSNNEETPEVQPVNEENVIMLSIDSYDNEVFSDSCTIHGVASASVKDCELKIGNEKIATIVAGNGTISWSKKLYLDKGSNTFIVTLSDEDGVTKSETVTIYRTVEESTPKTVTKTDGYLFASDRYYITNYDLIGKTKHEVALIRNEIYARHGYIFSTKEYADYFSQKSWYTPNPNFSESLFNSVEKANKEFLVQYETARGWR